jgi:ATP/ADP translocase
VVFSKNPFNTDILSPSVKEKTFEESIKILTDSRYISIITLSLLSKYQVKGMGLVPKWSKAHRQIKELYKQSKIDGHDFESN